MRAKRWDSSRRCWSSLVAGWFGLSPILVNLPAGMILVGFEITPAGLNLVGRMRWSGFLAIETTGIFQGTTDKAAFNWVVPPSMTIRLGVGQSECLTRRDKASLIIAGSLVVFRLLIPNIRYSELFGLA